MALIMNESINIILNVGFFWLDVERSRGHGKLRNWTECRLCVKKFRKFNLENFLELDYNAVKMFEFSALEVLIR